MRLSLFARSVSAFPRFVLAVPALLAALAALLAALAGCSGKRTPVTPVIPGPPAGSDYARILAAKMPSTFVLPSNVDTSATLLFSTDIDGSELAGALFRNGAHLVNAGQVFVRKSLAGAVADSTELDTLYFTFGGAPRTIYTTQKANPFGLDLPFDGATRHIFGVEGSGAFPALIDSIVSVRDAFITEPVLHGFYPKSQDLTISWSNPGTDTTVYVTASIAMIPDTTTRLVTGTVRDVGGQLVISSSALQTMPAGHATLAVARYRLEYRTIAGRRVGVLCSDVATRLFYLN